MRDASEIKKGSRGGDMFRDMFALTAKYWAYDPAKDGTDDDIGGQLIVDVSHFIDAYKDGDKRIAKLAEGFADVITKTLLDEEREFRDEQKSKGV